MTRYFSPRLFAFLRDLDAHNSREWFTAHQDDYERFVREPALDLITDFVVPLARISPEFRADARKVGGSLFRIQRDLRFSKDKTPYKTHTGIQFRHRAGSDAHAPGFYLHLEPRRCFFAAGVWRPPTAAAYAIRARLADEPAVWRRVTGSKRFAERFALEGDRLKRPPRGFDPEHPLVADLRRKDFIAVAPLTQRCVTSAGLLDELSDLSRRAAPFVRFLCEALGLPF